MARGKGKPVQKRSYVKQTDVPGVTLDEALRIPRAIFDHYGGKPTSPLFVAKALNVDPNGTQLKVLSGAAIAFGLTEGGSQADKISATDLAKRVLRPKEENADIAARRECVLKPRIFREFLEHYNDSQFPRPDIAQNVLEDMGVSREKAEEVYNRIEMSARSVGFLVDIKGKAHVSFETANGPLAEEDHLETNNNLNGSDINNYVEPVPPTKSPTTLASAIMDDERRRRVFITHGKNKNLVDPIRKFLEYGELEAVVSVERSSVSKPVPEKVMGDMRSCGAAIIHVDAEATIEDKLGVEHVIINPNVLIEIGAAMAFYGKRFILLVRDGVKLPSNLQGLFEVRYNGDTLDATAALKLLDAVKDIKNYPLPLDPKASE